MSDGYIRGVRRLFDVSDEAEFLFKRISKSGTADRESILRDVGILRTGVGLNYALLALYRQQVGSGFVLADPLKNDAKQDKEIYDPDTGITFRVQWNPHRELRKNHALLIEHKVIAENIDDGKLVNRDGKGRPCYLCKENIDVQNPGEILLEVVHGDERFYIGANFAYITDNHFTIMNAEHRPQAYRKEIPRILNAFTDGTDGYFRVIFNGLAGASIEWHEHMQATTAEFPIEHIRIHEKNLIHDSGDVRIARPAYYVPVWLIEGKDREKVETAADSVVRAWHGLNEQEHTENMIAVKSGEQYRIFVILRDRNKLASSRAGKKGAMAAFETGGIIVLSYEPGPEMSDIDERRTFDNADLDTIKQMLEEISPDRQTCAELYERIYSADFGI
ncbi:MAG: DUF4922 domain-containing protein [Planctomycetota bacterium]|jgi:hypothetical protein